MASWPCLFLREALKAPEDKLTSVCQRNGKLEKELASFPELYRLLGDIALKEGDEDKAALNYGIAIGEVTAPDETTRRRTGTAARRLAKGHDPAV